MDLRTVDIYLITEHYKNRMLYYYDLDGEMLVIFLAKLDHGIDSQLLSLPSHRLDSTIGNIMLILNSV